MNVLNLTQGTQPWLDWRAQGVSATDISVIMGLSPYKTAYRLWLEKTGRANPENLSGNPNVQRGNRLEPLAREYFENRDEEILLPVCAEYTDWPILRASLDGLSSTGIPYEFKAPTEKRFEELVSQGIESDTYNLYESQVKAQCVVLGASEGKLAFYMEDERVYEFRICLTQEDKDAIINAAQQFWDCIQNDTPPPLDPERDVYIPTTGEDEFRWRALADLWRENQEQIAAMDKQLEPLKQSQEELKRALAEMMGEFQATDYGGVKVSRFSRKGSIDYPKFCKEQGIDADALEAYRKKESWQSRVTLSKDETLNAVAIGNESTPVTSSGYF